MSKVENFGMPPERESRLVVLARGAVNLFFEHAFPPLAWVYEAATGKRCLLTHQWGEPSDLSDGNSIVFCTRCHKTKWRKGPAHLGWRKGLK